MRPITIALRTDFQWATGLRLLNVYLDRARVIMMARKRTVRFDLRSASRTSPGKTPPRFVRSATIRASDIMNALLDSSSFAFMRRVRCDADL